MKAGGSELPCSGPASREHAPPGQQSARGAAPELGAAGPSRPGARLPGPSDRAPAGRAGGGLPTLSSTKSPSRGRRRRPRVLAGRGPMAERTGTRGSAARGLPAAAHKATRGRSLRPWAPRLLPGGACCLARPPAPARLPAWRAGPPGTCPALRLSNSRRWRGWGPEWARLCQRGAAAGGGAGSACGARGGTLPGSPGPSGSRNILRAADS